MRNLLQRLNPFNWFKKTTESTTAEFIYELPVVGFTETVEPEVKEEMQTTPVITVELVEVTEPKKVRTPRKKTSEAVTEKPARKKKN